MTEALSPNTQAILLLTAPLVVGRGQKSADLLTPSEYKKLARRLHELKATPADLMTAAAGSLLLECQPLVDEARLERLLARGFLLGQAVERWHARAIWVVSRADSTYPQRVKGQLQEDSPAVLYGCGDRRILDSSGLAVVGSRHVDAALIEYAQGIGRLVATAHLTLVSGGARGIDQAAMRGALDAGGCAAGVLADSLERAVMQREHREMLLESHLVLISPYDPSAGFNVGHAMQRNKLIYSLAPAALVVNAEEGNGGTWAGAIEQLEKRPQVPVFVRRSGQVSAGLDALAKKGALPWPDPVDAEGLRAVLATPAPPRASSPQQSQLAFSPSPERPEQVREVARSAGGRTSPPSHRPALESRASAAEELFQKAKSLILRLMREPMKAAEVARELGVTDTQAQKWLKRLIDEGAVQKAKKDARYSACTPNAADAASGRAGEHDVKDADSPEVESASVNTGSSLI